MQTASPSCEVSLDRGDAGRLPGVLVSHAGDLLPAETVVCSLCTASLEKRIREEQTWQLQKTLQDSLFRFQDWLWAAEGLAACPNSSQVSYASSKRELQKFETLQRQVAEKLLPLESLNRQYRQLARSGHGRPQLRAAVQEVNQRWDALKVRAATVSKRLQHFVSQREEFELERETIQVWLMELDLRLTDLEHFSRGTALEKMIQLQAFQQDVQANAERVDHLLVRGELLIQKSQPEDAEALEEELQELSAFCQEVFRRVFCFRWRLVSIRLVFENEWLSDQDSDLESDCFTEQSLDMALQAEPGLPLPPGGPAWQSTPKRASPYHKQPDPNLGGVMDLEWDPSVDVGGSTSHEEEDSSYYSTITGVELWEEPSPRYRSFQHEHLPPTPLQWGSQEGFSGGAPQEDWGHLSLPLPEEETQIWNSEKFCAPGLDGYPKSRPLERGACHHVEPVGFDPKRIESWLGQSCPQRTEHQSTGMCTPASLPAPAWQFPGRPQRPKPRQRKARLVPSTRPGQLGKRKRPGLGSAAAAAAEALLEEGLTGPASRPSGTSSAPPFGVSSRAQKLPRTPALLSRTLLSSLGLLLLLFAASASLLVLPEPSCLQANSYASSFHLVLKYINGPPPT